MNLVYIKNLINQPISCWCFLSIYNVIILMSFIADWSFTTKMWESDCSLTPTFFKLYHGENMRHSERYPHAHRKLFKKPFTYSGPKLWNKLLFSIWQVPLKISEGLLLNTNWVIFQLYYGKNNLYSIRWWWCLLYTRPTRFIGSTCI